MKHEQIIIYVTSNGYLVEIPRVDGYARVVHSGSWTFESMDKLQKRLPEILDKPVEKRSQEI